LVLYILDTDICSYIISKHPVQVLAAMDTTVQQGHEIAISAMAYAELMLGAKCSGNPDKHITLINELCERLHDIYAWDTRAAEQFTDLQIYLLNQEAPIGINDTLIAAHVLSMDATLVTNNTKHFRKVPGLETVNWVGAVEIM
jgi:tRNA(fMet)-specific endonuclease VapC